MDAPQESLTAFVWCCPSCRRRACSSGAQTPDAAAGDLQIDAASRITAEFLDLDAETPETSKGGAQSAPVE